MALLQRRRQSRMCLAFGMHVHKKSPITGALMFSTKCCLSVFFLAAASLAFTFSRGTRLFLVGLLGFGGFFFLLLFIAIAGIADNGYCRYEQKGHQNLFHRVCFYQ